MGTDIKEVPKTIVRDQNIGSPATGGPLLSPNIAAQITLLM